MALILTMLDEKGKITHNIVVRGHKSNKILCVDSMYGDYNVFFKEDLNYKMNLPYFKIALVIEQPTNQPNNKNDIS